MARPRLLAAALARAESWLLEPPPTATVRPAPPVDTRPVVVVAAAGVRCGLTTVARGLAAELAARDVAGSAVVAGPHGRTLRPLARPAAVRLARSAERVGGGRARPAGRLCLLEDGDPVALAAGLRHIAPVVIEAARDSAHLVSLADAVVLVAAPHVEPALASVLAATLARTGPRPLLVLNRALDAGPSGRWHARLPEARPAAGAALAGYSPPGELGRSIATLAALVCGADR